MSATADEGVPATHEKQVADGVAVRSAGANQVQQLPEPHGGVQAEAHDDAAEEEEQGEEQLHHLECSALSLVRVDHVLADVQKRRGRLEEEHDGAPALLEGQQTADKRSQAGPCVNCENKNKNIRFADG